MGCCLQEPPGIWSLLAGGHRQRARREDKRPRVLWGGASSGLLPCLGWPVGSRPRKAPMLCVHGCCVEGACMSVPGPQKELPTGHQLPTSGDCGARHLSSLAGRSILCIYVMRPSVPGVTPSPTGPRTPRSAEPTPVRPALRGGAASGHDYGTRMCCPHSHEARSLHSLALGRMCLLRKGALQPQARSQTQECKG